MGRNARNCPDVGTRGAPAWDRFGNWPRQRALLGLIALALMVLAPAVAPVRAGKSEVRTSSLAETVTGSGAALADRPRDDDLKLYDRK